MEGLIQQLQEHMAQLTANSTAQISQLTNQTAAQMAELVATNTRLLQKITQLEATQAAYPPPPTVPKKGTDESGAPKRRMVIDFSKLNSHTIKDRYPIPDINTTLQNLGNAKVFSTIFQRCVDDILRPYITKFAYVYIDDVFIYSNSAHLKMRTFYLTKGRVSNHEHIYQNFIRNA